MTRYWVGDAHGRVLGPVTLEMLEQLTRAGRLRGVQRVSTDGQQFGPLEQYPEVARLFAPQTPQSRAQADQEEAEKLLQRIRALQGKPVHEVFKLPADASIDAFRAAFFSMVKRFYPATLPTEAHDSLRLAYREMFQLLSSLMTDIERHANPVPVAPAPPTPAPSTPGKAAPSALRTSYEPQDFVGWERRENNRVFVDMKVTVQSVGMLTENKLVNISNGGVFLAMQKLLPLGEKLDLSLQFDAPRKTLTATGMVVWVNEQADRRQPRGVGVRFVKLGEEDRRFIEYYVRKALLQK